MQLIFNFYFSDLNYKHVAMTEEDEEAMSDNDIPENVHNRLLGAISNLYKQKRYSNNVLFFCKTNLIIKEGSSIHHSWCVSEY